MALLSNMPPRIDPGQHLVLRFSEHCHSAPPKHGVPLTTRAVSFFFSCTRFHGAQELMRYFFSADDVEPDTEDTPTMAAFRALGLDPDREPDALKV